FAEHGHAAIELRYEQIVGRYGEHRGMMAGGIALEECPLVVARIIPDGTLEQLIVRVDLLHALEERGVTVVNSAKTIERTVNKARTTALLEAAGLPTPETVVCETIDDAMEAFRRLGDVILKPLFGSMGLGMLRLREEEMAWRAFRTVDRIGGVFYLQKTIDHGGSDVRAFVIGDCVLAAIERRADGWCTSVARGAKPIAIRLDPQREHLALAAAKAVDADYAGVDLIDDRNGTSYVIEVNGIPGWRGLQEATGIDVAHAIAAHALEFPSRDLQRAQTGAGPSKSAP
ncbi:MAG: RimK family alpha-L-glutamate ligase, partial [Planctomycetota bacterium]|nr:RimK family alpha-L-glutamate ligase [Planctomycetota bacterium]